MSYSTSNNVGDVGALSLAGALEVNSSLKIMNLKLCSISPFSDFMPNNPFINQIGEFGKRVLGKAKKAGQNLSYL